MIDMTAVDLEYAWVTYHHSDALPDEHHNSLQKRTLTHMVLTLFYRLGCHRMCKLGEFFWISVKITCFAKKYWLCLKSLWKFRILFKTYVSWRFFAHFSNHLHSVYKWEQQASYYQWDLICAYNLCTPSCNKFMHSGLSNLNQPLVAQLTVGS